MTDKPLEGNPEAQGGTDANPSPSSADSQPLGGDLASLIANLQKKIDAQDGEIRALKSGKDKAVSRVEKSTEELVAKLAKYLDVDEKKVMEAQRQSILDDLVAERLGKVQPETPIPGRVDAQGRQTELGLIDTALELPANDSRVIELKLKHASDPITYLREGVKLQQSFKTTPPTPAEAILPQGGVKSQDKSKEARRDEYIKEMQAVKPGDAAAVRALKSKYIQLGVDVDNVGWH